MFVSCILMLIGGTVMVPWTCPCPNPRNLWRWQVTWQGGLREQMLSRLLISWHEEKEMVRGYPRWSSVITMPLNGEDRGSTQSQGDAEWEGLNQRGLPLKMEEESTSQGLRAAFGGWKRQGEGFSPKTSSKKCSLADILTLAQWDPLKSSDL